MATMANAKIVRSSGARWLFAALILGACGPVAEQADAAGPDAAGSDAAGPDAADAAVGADHSCLFGVGPGPCDAAAASDLTASADVAGTADSATDGPADTGPARDGAVDAGAAQLHLITAQQLSDMLASKDFLLIDVRGGTPASQIPQTDSTIVYTDTDGLVAIIGSDPDARVVLYCNSGNRSGIAGNALVGRGYRAIHSLSGGISSWIAQGFPVVTPGQDGG